MIKTPGPYKVIPIHVWIKTLILIVLVFWGGFATFLFFEYELMQSSLDDLLLETTESNITLDRESSDVYILGSSQTDCALCKFGSFSLAIEEKDEDLGYKTTIRKRVVLSDFSHHIDQLKLEKPKYLFIESNIICLNMFKSGEEINLKFTLLIKRYSIWLKAIISSIISRNDVMSGIIKSLDHNTDESEVDLGLEYWNKYERHARKYEVRTVDDFPEWNAFFEEAEKEGIQVCILELPRSKEAKEHLPKKIKRQYNRLIDQYKKKYNIEYIAFPYELEQKTYFRDAAHLNRKGAELYSSWLLEVLTEKTTQSSN